MPLDLPDDRETRTTVKWRYQYSPKNLVEEVEGLRYVYGSWDHLFGCWQNEAEGRPAREVIPHWSVMDEGGVWRTCDISFRMRFPKTNVRRSRKWHRQERAAFIAYLSSIPRPIRSLVAPFGPYSWLLLDMIWQVPEFAKFLDQEIRANYGQFVVAVLVLSGASRLSRSRRKDLAGEIMSAKRKKLINSLISVPEGGRVLKVLNRLGDYHHEPEFYFELASVMHCPKRSHLLSHEKSPTWEFVFGLKRLPDELLVPPMIRVLEARRLQSYSQLRNLINFLEVAPTHIRSRIVDAIRNVGTPEEARRMVRRWEEKLLEFISFPEAPLSPHNHLTPLSTPDAMRQEAHSMQNCLSQMVGDVVSGGVFYYHWEGPERATVRIRNTNPKGGGQWIFAGAAGARNRKLPNMLIDYLKSLIDRLEGEKVHKPEIEPPPLKPPIHLEKTDEANDERNAEFEQEIKK